jgi:pilus assembly protein Flp/PilA
MLTLIKNLGRDESGQDLIEYALLAALLGLACIVSMGTVATKINAKFTAIGTALGT